ncbi:MAG: YheV family putative zinc ribbon protein [Oceanicoccus sp.]
MSDAKIIKRFIAGAVCPRCAEMDKLMMYQDTQQQQVRECVRCGYQDVMTDNGPRKIDAEEIVTRVNQPRIGEAPLAHEDEIQVVSIIDPNPGAKRRDH